VASLHSLSRCHAGAFAPIAATPTAQHLALRNTYSCTVSTCETRRTHLAKWLAACAVPAAGQCPILMAWHCCVLLVALPWHHSAHTLFQVLLDTNVVYDSTTLDLQSTSYSGHFIARHDIWTCRAAPAPQCNSVTAGVQGHARLVNQRDLLSASFLPGGPALASA
jgi:hypothetical protein